MRSNYLVSLLLAFAIGTRALASVVGTISDGGICRMDNFAVENRSYLSTFCPVADPGNYCIDFKGSLYFPEPGEYAITLTTDDSSSFALDGTELLNDLPSVHAASPQTANVTVTAAGWHPYQLTYCQLLPTEIALMVSRERIGSTEGSQIIPPEYWDESPRPRLAPPPPKCAPSTSFVSRPSANDARPFCEPPRKLLACEARDFDPAAPNLNARPVNGIFTKEDTGGNGYASNFVDSYREILTNPFIPRFRPPINLSLGLDNFDHDLAVAIVVGSPKLNVAKVAAAYYDAVNTCAAKAAYQCLDLSQAPAVDRARTESQIFSNCIHQASLAYVKTMPNIKARYIIDIWIRMADAIKRNMAD